MAQIDLRNSHLYIKDGYLLTGAVNLVAGYTVGATTIAVDGFVGAVAVGDPFKIGADTTIYTVTAHTETTSNTTSITFTPPLVAMAADDAVITVGPHQLEVAIGEGNVTFDEKRMIIYTKNRGRLDFVRQGDDEPMEVKFDFIWEFLTATSGQPPTIEDALKQRGNAANWVTSNSDPCAPYCVDMEIEYDPPCTSVFRELTTLPEFYWESLAHDLKNGVVNITGKCNSLQAVPVRAA